MAERLAIFSNPLLYVGIFFLAAVIVAVKMEFFETKRPVQGQTHDFKWFINSLIDMALTSLALFLVFLIVAFPITLWTLWPKVAQAMVKPWWRALGLVFLFGLALGVNFFKSESMRWYGIVEVLVGLMIAWGALSSPAAKGGGLFQGVALAGSVYALVSGIGDFLKGREESKKPWFQAR